MIYTENTPNPNAVKFVSELTFSEIGTKEFQKKDINEIKNNFIQNLLTIDGVELVLIGDTFISVKKLDTSDWETIKPTVISTINDYFEKNKKPVLQKHVDQIKSENTENESDIVKQIKDVLDTKIRPAVSKDGGDIKFVSFKNGTVKVELKGSCSGCPSSIITLKNGVQNLLKHYVKDVTNVEAL
tara:strand:+ start:72 stop:626 length:555 start_codon:yes stop_codon:yes gene_type:complete